MTQVAIGARMKPVLDGLMRTLEAELQLAGQNARTVVLDQTSIGRLSRMDALQQQAMAQASTQRMALQKRRVEAALGRVDAGRYGLCCECGDAIDGQRLLSDPATPFCMGCQTERDAAR